MQHSDVVTYFHEFGHLMHAILGGQQQWRGSAVLRRKGILSRCHRKCWEEFFRDAKLLQTFARNYQTGEPIPAELVATMNQAGAFGRADWCGRSFSIPTTRSMCTTAIRMLPARRLISMRCCGADYERFLPYQWIDGNRMYASFTHLCGYSSNYYTYLYDR